MDGRIESTILSFVIHDESYARKALPFVKAEYFQEKSERLVYETITSYFEKYGSVPTIDAVLVELSQKKGVNQDLYNETTDIVSSLKKKDKPSEEWLIDVTEKFCQDQAIFNAVYRSIKVIESEKEERGNIPKMLSDALAVSFDTNIGHDFLEMSDNRFDYYHRKEQKIAFGIKKLDEITKGGAQRKAMYVFMSETGLGKTLTMTNCASNNLLDGKNVLYITAEMSEEEISKRVEANLMDVPLDMLVQMPKDVYDRKIAKLKSRTVGKLVIKEYPTGSAHVGHFRFLLNELRLKKNFVPDVIYVDYINICASSRIKPGNASGTYSLVKSITEEFRGLAVEYNVALISATQANRSGYGNGDMDITSTSESIGLPQTVDFLLALMAGEIPSEILCKQLKNRFSDINIDRKFVVGVDRSKMKIYDVPQRVEDQKKPTFDDTKFSEREEEVPFINGRKNKFKKFS